MRHLSEEQFGALLEQRHRPDPFGVHFGGFSSSEVEGMSPEQHQAMLHHAASIQRGEPEQRMLDIQRLTRGGVYSHAVEHVGDLTHRINERGGAFGTEFVEPKVRTTLRSLTHPYGFGREHEEQMRSVGVDPERLAEAGEAYSQAHLKVPVYNAPSEHGRWAAWSLGKQRFQGAATHLASLQRLTADPDRYRHMMSQQGTVEYLRKKEE